MTIGEHEHAGMTDRHLIVAAKRGCHSALSVLVDRHHSHVLYHVLTLESDPGRARDLVQETFEDALRSLDRMPEDRPLRAWLFQTARNNYLHDRRQRKVRELVSLEWLSPSIKKSLPELRVDDSSGRYAKQDMVRKLLAEISPKLREPLVLISLGYSIREIGEILNISHPAARKRVSRAMQQFRDRYDELDRGTD